jgi:hypothetical protein
VDDAHAAENYIAGYWTLSIRKSDNSVLWAALAGILKPHLDGFDHKRLLHDPKWPTDVVWVEKIPTPALQQIAESLIAILDEHLAHRSEQWYSWSVLRDKILACHLYVSATEISLRPLIAQQFSF